MTRNSIESIIELEMADIELVYEEMKRKAILSQYNYSYLANQDLWTWNMPDPSSKNGRKKIRRKTKEAIENFILEYHKDAYGVKGPTVDQVFDKYRSDAIKDNSLAASSVNRYRNHYNKYILPHKFAQLDILQVTIKDIKALLDTLVKGKAGDDRITKRNFNDVKSIINSIFSYARNEMELEVIYTKEPMGAIVYKKRQFKPVKKVKEEKVYSQDEAKRIILHLSNNQEIRGLGLLFIFFTGLRVSELCLLKHSSVNGDILTIDEHLSRDINARYCIAPGAKEGEEEKEIILSEQALYIWKSLRKESLKRGYSSEYIFYTDNVRESSYGFFVPNHFDGALRRICKKLDIPFRSPHKIRTTHISIRIDNGVSPIDVQKSVGHKDLSTTLKNYLYQTKSKEQLKESFDLADNVLTKVI